MLKCCPTQKLGPKSFTAHSEKYLQCILISLARLLLCTLAGMCCLCSDTAWVVLLSCCSRAAVVAAWYQGSWWCFILRSGVPQLWCSWGGGSASRPRGKCCKRRCCSVSTWLECPEIIACRGGASLCSLLPPRKPLVLVAEKLCRIKIPSVLLACQSVKNKILNSASRWIP